MRKSDLNSMPTDELWALHEKIATCLAAELTAEKIELERRLEQLKARNGDKHRHSLPARRPYPKSRVRNFEILTGRRKLGLVEASNRAGYLPS